MDDLTDTITTP